MDRLIMAGALLMAVDTALSAIARVTPVAGVGVGAGVGAGMGKWPPIASKSAIRSAQATPFGAFAAPFASWSGVNMT